MKKIYKPTYWLILIDVSIIIFNIIFVLGLFPLTSKTPFHKYQIPAYIFTLVWIINSYIFKRYVKLKKQQFQKAAISLFYTSVITFSIFAGFIIIQKASPFSQYVLYSIMSGVFVSEYLFLFIYFAYRYAVQYEVPFSTVEKRENAQLIPSPPLTTKEINQRKEKLNRLLVDKKLLENIESEIDVMSSATKIDSEFNLQKTSTITNYRYSSFVQLKKLNKIRGINKMLYLYNEKLADDGKVAILYVANSSKKRSIFKKYPKVINNIVYAFYFFFHRILPKILLTQRFYYDITLGAHRMLSKTEVLGRLVFCGFKIETQQKIGNYNLVIARRVKQSEPIKPRRNYGPFIKLQRRGKNGKLFNVYKLRTMHPYAEFLQSYMYETYNLQEGGKFNRDIRISTIGKLARKYWFDELPMVLNLIKGEMKIVGVRPLSAQYFSLYSKELQEERTKFKPGLLPPFYADLPKTLDEIQASEMKYLKLCEKNGVFKTDISYLFKILENIFIKKARSA